MSILIDANVLLYAKFTDFPQHDSARQWLDSRLNQPDPVGIPWVSLSAFARIATNRRIFDQPLTPEDTAEQVKQWAGRKNVWFPGP
ncbi:MAG: VapC toxin family PIN domain ribonuclease, partial [Wenzhouxiangella sp.]